MLIISLQTNAIKKVNTYRGGNVSVIYEQRKRMHVSQALSLFPPGLVRAEEEPALLELGNGKDTRNQF